MLMALSSNTTGVTFDQLMRISHLWSVMTF